MRTPLMIAVLSLSPCAAHLPAAETIIVNAKSSAPSLDDDDMRSYFLGKKTTWSDGSRVVVVVLRDGASHDALLKLLGKSSSQFSTGWKKLIFTGKGAMPEQVDSEDELVEFVARTPGAIAFVDAGKVKDGVKAVSIK